MTPQERELLDGLFARIRSAAGAPRDPEAEAFIADAAREQPYAAYLLAQTVIVQEETLKAAAARLEELEGKVRTLEEAAASAAAAPTSFLGGVGKSLFGGAPQQPAPQSPALSARSSVPSTGAPGIAMPNVTPPGARWTRQGQPLNAADAQAPQQQGGNSFLKGALGAAAGVAGGMLLANSLSGLFGGGAAQAGDKAAPATSEAARNSPWGSDRESGNRSAADDGFSGSEDAGADDAWAEEDAWGADDDGGWDDED